MLSSQSWVNQTAPNLEDTQRIIDAFNACFYFQTCCSVSERECIKGDCGRKLRPILHFFIPVKIGGGVGKLSELRFQVQPKMQSLMYFWCRAAARAGRINTISWPIFPTPNYQSWSQARSNFAWSQDYHRRFQHCRFQSVDMLLLVETGVPQERRLGQISHFRPL